MKSIQHHLPADTGKRERERERATNEEKEDAMPNPPLRKMPRFKSRDTLFRISARLAHWAQKMLCIRPTLGRQTGGLRRQRRRGEKNENFTPKIAGGVALLIKNPFFILLIFLCLLLFPCLFAIDAFRAGVELPLRLFSPFLSPSLPFSLSHTECVQIVFAFESASFSPARPGPAEFEATQQSGQRDATTAAVSLRSTDRERPLGESVGLSSGSSGGGRICCETAGLIHSVSSPPLLGRARAPD